MKRIMKNWYKKKKKKKSKKPSEGDFFGKLLKVCSTGTYRESNYKGEVTGDWRDEIQQLP